MDQKQEPKKYILYCAQVANFQTRSMLIPHDLIMKCPKRVKNINTLREHSKRNVKFEHKGRGYIVDQLLIDNIIWEKGQGRHEPSKYLEILEDFTNYAECVPDEGLLQLYDKQWIGEIICGVASDGFNNVMNYCNFRNKSSYHGRPINIVEGFLVLESNNGKISMPPVDTVREMYEKYY